MKLKGEWEIFCHLAPDLLGDTVDKILGIGVQSSQGMYVLKFYLAT